MPDQQGTRAEPDGSLPAVTAVRTRVRERGRDAVVVEFANGARLRYRETDGPVEEAWLPPEADPADPAVLNDRETEAGAEALALRALAEYLSFDGRRRAAFVWGEENLGALLGERQL